MNNRIDILLVADSDYYLPEASPISFGNSFSPMYEYLYAPLKAMDLPLQYQLAAPQRHTLAVLGGYLKSKGHAVMVIDNIFRSQQAEKDLAEALSFDPPVIGISAGCISNINSIKSLIKGIKSAARESIIVLGGMSACNSEEMQSLANVTIKGLGEKSLDDIVTALKAGRELSDVPGFHLNDRHAGIIDNGEHYESIPHTKPDWSVIKDRPSFCYTIEASKGCAHSCAFCNYPGQGRQDYRAPEDVLAEAIEDRDLYNAQYLRFIDHNLTSDPGFISAFAELAQAQRLSVPWSCFARIDDLARHPSLAQDLKKAGCFWIYAGLESVNDRILEKMNKGYTSGVIEQGLKAARQAGLMVHANFIIGYPGETAQTIRETTDFICRSTIDTVSFTVLGMTERLETYASEQDDNLLGLRRENGHWTHETMDYKAAAAHVRSILKDIINRTDTPLPLSHGIAMYYLLGGGLSIPAMKAYFSTIRNWHKPSGKGPAFSQSDLKKLYNTAAYRFRL